MIDGRVCRVGQSAWLPSNADGAPRVHPWLLKWWTLTCNSGMSVRSMFVCPPVGQDGSSFFSCAIRQIIYPSDGKSRLLHVQ